MLVRLYPEQVSKGWKIFAPMIQKTLAPSLAIDSRVMANVLRSVLVEDSQAWLEIDKEEGVGALALTAVEYDKILNKKQLYVHSLTVVRSDLSRQTWVDGLETLKNYADSIGASELIMPVVDERFVSMLEGFGAEVDTINMRLEV